MLVAPGILWLLTWKNLAEGLWIGLTGWQWVGAAMVVAMCAVLPLVGVAVVVFKNFPEYREHLWLGLRCLAGVALFAKTTAAVRVVRVLHRRRFVTARRLDWIGVLWFLTVAFLFGLAGWLLPPGLVAPLWLAVDCAFLVPFTRLAVAPLAFEWNRHR